MVDISRKTKVLEGVTPDDIPVDDLMRADEPVILKGLVSGWELVKQGQQSAACAMDYLQSMSAGRTLLCYRGEPEIRGKFFYNTDMTAMNFSSAQMQLEDFLQEIRRSSESRSGESFYVGSTTLDTFFPQLRQHNDVKLQSQETPALEPLVSIWLGNQTTASAHYDLSNNLACCTVGRRRFTLFPPEQIANLYPGPLEPTPGGQVVSMVDFGNPNLEKHPNFEHALAAGQVADLEPGDGLFYPSMWWHQVEALDDFNVMINYWWNTSPKHIDSPMTTLLHGLMSLRQRPEHEKRAWQALFDYYLFGPQETAIEHLPEHVQGHLGIFGELQSRRLRAQLLSSLNR